MNYRNNIITALQDSSFDKEKERIKSLFDLIKSDSQEAGTWKQYSEEFRNLKSLIPAACTERHLKKIKTIMEKETGESFDQLCEDWYVE